MLVSWYYPRAFEHPAPPPCPPAFYGSNGYDECSIEKHLSMLLSPSHLSHDPPAHAPQPTYSNLPIRAQPAGPSQGMLDTHSAAEAALMATTTGSPPASSACTVATTCRGKCPHPHNRHR